MSFQIYLHIMFLLLPENRKSIHGKKLLKNLTLQILNSILVNFPHNGLMLILSLFSLQ